jgi:hypothetical protein
MSLFLKVVAELKSFVARDKGLTHLKIDPCLDPLRPDSRFQDLVTRVGLPSS